MTIEATPTPVTVPDLNIRQLNIRLVGTTPLIAHRFGDAAMSAMESAQQKAGKVAKAARDPLADFNDARYRLSDGRDGFPLNGISKAIVSAVIRNLDDIKGTEARAAFVLSATDMEDGLVPLNADEPEMRRDRVKVGMSHSIAYRPMYREWSIDVTVDLFAGTMSVEQFYLAVKLAGTFIGIGDWRPEKSGTFGRFDAVPA